MGHGQMENLICTDNRYKESDLHRWGPGTREVYALHYIISGRGFVSTNKKIAEVKQGEAFLVFPFTEVYYYPDEEDPWEYIWVDFIGEEAEQLIHKTGFTKDNPVMKCEEDVVSHFSIFDHAKEYQKKDRYSAKLRYLLTYFYVDQIIPPKKQSEHYLSLILEYIHNNYWKGSISVTGISEYLNIERSYLFRIFKKEIGISIVQYLTEYRMKKACNLLQTTDLSVKVIACSVGYEDAMYFSKLFHKEIGFSPRDYRKSTQLPLSR